MWRLWWGSAYSGRKGRDREKAWEGGTMEEKSVDGRLGVEKTMEIKVVKERNVVESLPVEAKPHMIIWASASLWMKIQA
jgi:hypothetical protein